MYQRRKPLIWSIMQKVCKGNCHTIFEGEIPHDHSKSCWIWMGKTNSNGYGRMNINKKTRPVHVIVFELIYKRIILNDGSHLCENPPCCNPEHIVDMTRKENMQYKFRNKPGWRSLGLPHKPYIRKV